MKKILIAFSFLLAMSFAINAQTTPVKKEVAKTEANKAVQVQKGAHKKSGKHKGHLKHAHKAVAKKSPEKAK